MLLLPLLMQGQSTLDNYIQEALSSNLALQQKELSYTKSLAALKEAKAMYLPVLAVNARYSRANGGRTFDIPIGDLMNPIYTNINLLNDQAAQINGGFPEIPDYPQIENQSVNFLRSEEHDTKLQLILPIFNQAIRQANKINQQQAEVERISVDVYKNELIQEVKDGYFSYLQTLEAIKLFENTLTLVTENVRTSNSLFKNHKVTIDVVYAAEAQVKEVETQLTEAKMNERLAAAYFNFLLNRAYNTPIQTTEPSELTANVLTLEQARAFAFQKRPELQQLDAAVNALHEKVKLDKAQNQPNLSLVGDYGFQGTSYSFTNEDDYMMGSLVLNWDLFNRQTKFKAQQSTIEKDRMRIRKEEVTQQIGLEVVQAFYQLETSRKNIDLNKAQVESAQKAFRLVNKKYKQGQANLVTFIDARTRLTNAEQQLIIANYDYQKKIAQLEKAVGSNI